MRINLRQIEVFRAIMLTHSMSGAAKALHVSQPAVSRLVSHTEQRLGLKLFERIKGRLYPTPEADQLFAEVSAVYNSVQRVNQVAEDLLDHRSGALRIACSHNLSQSLLPRAIRAFLKRYPDVRIALQTKPPQALLQSLFAHQVELGIAYMPVSHPALAMELLYENQMVAVLPSTHKLARRKEVHIEDLLDEPFIGYASDIPFGQLVRQLYAESPRKPQARIEVEQVHVACELVEAGVGIALADEQTVAGRKWRSIVTRPVVPNVPTPVHVFYPLYKPLSRSAQEFVAILRTPSAFRS
ncbi:MAG: LysR family transcriptional regulator [Rhodospirillales bacterium]|nr:LysR family transcriptional regulator [Rhodospirillales bacterium]